MPAQRMSTVSLTGRLLGALFSVSPGVPEGKTLVASFADGSWHEQWPVQHDSLPGLARQFREGVEETNEPLSDAFQRLFIGPWALPAPPWGSVWLDRENVLFGESMLELRQWMDNNGIQVAAGDSEPCDHIGTLLMLSAWLAESGNNTLLEQLLAWHLLPWVDRFLEVFIAEANHPFYITLGELTHLTLAGWRCQMVMPVVEKPLYR